MGCGGGEPQPNLTPNTKINSRCITDRKVKHKTLVLLEETIEKHLYDFRDGSVFLNETQKSQAMKERI